MAFPLFRIFKSERSGYDDSIQDKNNDRLKDLFNKLTLTDCTIQQVAKSAAIQKLYKTCTDIERGTRILAEQFFVQKEQQEIEIVLLNADKRYQIFQKNFPQVEQQIPQYHIASYLGIVPIRLSHIRKISGK